MRTIINLFLAIALLISTFNLNAQSHKTLKDSSTVIIFNQTSTSTYKKKKPTGVSNIIKIAPLGFLSGTYPILYERRITDFFTVQGALGFTGKNLVRNAIQNDGGNSINLQYSWGTSNTDISAAPYDFTLRTAKMGTMFSIQPRFYFDSEAPEGSYFGLSYDYYKYNFSIPGITGNATNYVQNGAPKSEFDQISDFMVLFGRQSVYDRLTFDSYTALGLRGVKGSRYAATAQGNSIMEGTSTFKQSILNFNIGIKVGYHF